MEAGKPHLIKVVGIDPALRNFGFATAMIDIDKDEIASIEALELVKTDDQAGKVVRRNSDDLRRANLLAEAVRRLTDPAEGLTLAFVEVPVGSQSARAMASYGVCIGVLTNCKCGMIEVTPTEVKVNAVKIKTATKQEMIDWAHGLFPEAPWLMACGKLKNENEHLADAIGAINAGLKTAQWKQVKSMLRLTAGS